jgi:hypothetical protein
MKHLILLAISILILDNGYSQGNYDYSHGMYDNGKIIKKSGEEITCLVPLAMSYGDNINYKMTKDSEVKLISVSDIKYLQTPYNVYENVRINKSEKLMRIISSGKMFLYCYIISSDPPSQGGYSYVAHDPNYVIKKDSLIIEVKKSNFKDLFTEKMNDCITIADKIKNKDYKFKDIEKVVTEYNNCNK